MDQIKFLDQFVKHYGFKGINDYKTQITTSQYKNKDQLTKSINGDMDQIKKLFKTSQLQLARKNYKIDTVMMAFSLLKGLLKQANINYSVSKSNGKNYLRLIPENNKLREYIDTKMNDIVTGNVKHVINENGTLKVMTSEESEQLSKKQPDMFKELDFDEFMDSLKIVKCANTKLLKYIHMKYHSSASGSLLMSLVQLSKPDDYANGVESNNESIILETVGEKYKILNDGRILKEITISRNYDVIYNFNLTLADSFGRLLDNSEYIDESLLIVGGHILTKDALNYQKKIPTVSCKKSDIKLIIIFKKYDSNVLETTIAVSYVGIYLQSEPILQLTQRPIKYGDYQIVNGEIINNNIDYKHNTINYLNIDDDGANNMLSYGIMNHQRFILPRDHSAAYNFSFVVCDLDGKEYPELLRFVKLIIGDTEVITKTNTKLKKIQFKEFDKKNSFIFKSFIFSDIKFDFDLYQPLKAGQFVKVEYNYLDLEDNIIDKISKTPYYFANMIVMENSTINIRSIEYIKENNIQPLASLLK